MIVDASDLLLPFLTDALLNSVELREVEEVPTLRSNNF